MSNDVRLIDANALILEMEAGCIPIDEKGLSDILGDNSCVKDYVNAAPTIDAEPVRHGKWRKAEYGSLKYFKCSNCDYGVMEKEAKEFNFCPNCGAKMDGGVS